MYCSHMPRSTSARRPVVNLRLSANRLGSGVDINSGFEIHDLISTGSATLQDPEYPRYFAPSWIPLLPHGKECVQYSTAKDDNALQREARRHNDVVRAIACLLTRKILYRGRYYLIQCRTETSRIVSITH
jgi:hypothetical protein